MLGEEWAKSLEIGGSSQSTRWLVDPLCLMSGPWFLLLGTTG